MKKICANPECRKEFESNYKNKRFCCKECGKKVFYQEHKEYWNHEPKRKKEAEQKRIKAENDAKKEKRREPRIVKSHGGKITGGFDYFMISTN